MWLPETPIYLEKSGTPVVRPTRPLHQGDIFMDVPLAISRATSPTVEETHPTRLVNAALVGHPCSVRAGPRLLPVQTVALVQPKDEAVPADAPPFAPPWDGYYHLFPLPELMNGQDYVVNFRKIGTTPSSALSASRIACLSHHGWTAFQRRYANYSVRLNPPHEVQLEANRPEWEETRLWEEWNGRGHPENEFEAWIRAPLSPGFTYSGTERKAVLGYAAEMVWEDLP